MSAVLPRIIKQRGFTLTCIAREGRLAIYRQSWRDSVNHAFEVIRIRTLPRRVITIGGKAIVLPAGEVYPTSTQWGVNGFTVTDKDAAFAKLKSLQGAKV